MWSHAGKSWSITFLAVDDEVSFLVPRCYGVDYTIAIWVFGQNRGDESVGPRILGNECSIAAKRKFNKCKRVRKHTRKSMIETHTDSRYKSFYTVQSISSLIRLMVVAFACHYDLTCPLSWPDWRQMIMSTGGWWSHWTNGASTYPAHCGPFDPVPFKMSTVICLLCGAGQRDAQRDTGDWYTTGVQSAMGWRWTARLGGRGDEEKWKTEQRRGEGKKRSRWQKRRLALKWQVKWYVGVREEEERGAGREEGGRLIDREDVREGRCSRRLWVDSSAELIPCEIRCRILFQCVCESMCVCVWGVGGGVGVCSEKSEVIDGLQKNADGWFISASCGSLRGNMSDL